MMGQIRAIIHNNEKKILIKIEKFSEFKELPQNIQKKNKKKEPTTNPCGLLKMIFISFPKII
jgi:hypothetical protein